MQTQRDHVHAHQFMMGRMSAALVLGDPHSVEIPGRRSLIGLIVGLVLGLLVVAGFGVYGWIMPGGGKGWREAGAIIVEKETGNRYVLRDGALWSPLNMTSAMLLQGPRATVELTARKSLTGVPRAGSIGIADAPQSVPAAESLRAGPWLACLTGSVAGGRRDGVGLNLDPAAAATRLPDDRLLLVSGPGQSYLVWRSQKLLVKGPVVLAALGLSAVEPVSAPPSWLATLPTGPELGTRNVDAAGQPGGEIGGRQYAVGRLFRQRPAATGGDEQRFVLLRDGLAPLDRMEFQLMDAQPGRAEPVTLDAAAVAAAPRSADRSYVGRLPDLTAVPWQNPAGQAVCQLQQPAAPDRMSTAVVLTAPRNAGIAADGRPRVSLPPGSGMVVTAWPKPPSGVPSTTYLLADEGTAYPVPATEDLAALKLNGRAPVPFPRAYLDAMPKGPALARAAVTVAEKG